MRWVLFNIVTLEIQIVYQNFISKNLLTLKLSTHFARQSVVEVAKWLTEDWLKSWEKAISF